MVQDTAADADTTPESDASLPGVHIDFTHSDFLLAVFDGNRVRIAKEDVIADLCHGGEMLLTEGAVYLALDLDRRRDRGATQYPPYRDMRRMVLTAAKVGRKIRRLRNMVEVWSVLSS